MKTKILTIIAGLILTLTLFQMVEAQKLPAKEATLMTHLLKESSRPDYLEGDVFLTVTIGKIEYLAALKSGKVVKQRKAKYTSGGFYGAFAEIRSDYVNDDWQNGGQGGSQLLKLSGGQWKKIALNEGDYQCRDVKSVPKSVLKALKVECID